MKAVLFIPLFLFSIQSLLAQGDISDEKKALFRNEYTYSLMLNSNGWGGGFTYGKMLNVKRKRIWNIELLTIKDSKEYKVNHPSHPDKKRFVYGKSNECFNIRLGYGNLINLYDKKDKGGIEIRCFYHVGLVGGFLKPIYYITDETPNLVEEKFNAAIHDRYDILGGASFFKGFDELTVLPGIFIKVGASFEFGRKDIVINAIEGGLTLDLFPKDLEIMANDQNNFAFMSIFVSYRFGKIVNPRAKLSNKHVDESK